MSRGRQVGARLAPLLILLAAAAIAHGDDPQAARESAPPSFAPPQEISIAVPGTALSVTVVEVPITAGAPPLWFGRTEVPWELLDVFVFKLDELETTPGADAVTRPSKPYISMDRGYGHHGFPAISVSHRNAVEFCVWLSAKTGKRFRLPTRDEWRSACARGELEPATVQDRAWCKENAERKSHAVATRASDGAGLYDMLGNACEWVSAGDENFVVMGGSYRDPASALRSTLEVASDPAWNASDPQIPRSEWWLADGGFIGFRVVCEDAHLPPTAPPASPTPPPHDRPTTPYEKDGEKGTKEKSP